MKAPMVVIDSRLMTMKKHALTLMAVCSFSIAWAQASFSYDGFTLNQKVSFNDVANKVKPAGVILTEASVYQQGEDIKYVDDDGTQVTLMFFEGTQTLSGIAINNMLDTHGDMHSFARDYLVLKRLGTPIAGFDIRIFRQGVMGNQKTYQYHYAFPYSNSYYIEIIGGDSGSGVSQNGTWIPSYQVSTYLRTSPVRPIALPSALQKTGKWSQFDEHGRLISEMEVIKVY